MGCKIGEQCSQSRRAVARVAAKSDTFNEQGMVELRVQLTRNRRFEWRSFYAQSN